MAPTQMVGREPDRRRNGHTSMRVLGAGVALIVTLVGGMTLGRISRGEQGAGETSPVSPTETVAEVTPAFDCRLAAHTAEFLICDHSALALLDVVLSRVYPTTMAAQQGNASALREMKSRNPRWLATRDQCVDFECVFAAYQGYLLEEPLRRSLWSALETTPEIGGSHEGCVWRVILPDMTVRFEFARQESAGCQQDRPMAITYRGTPRAVLAAASSTLPACRGQGSRSPTAVTTVSVREMIATIDCLAKELRSAPEGPTLSSDAGEFMPSGWQAVARRGRAGGRVSSLTAYYGYALMGRSSRTIEIFLVPGGLGRIVDTYAGIDNSGDSMRRTTTVDSVYVWRDSILSRKRVRAETDLLDEGENVGERWSADISDFDISSLRFVRTVSRLVAQRDKRGLEALVGDESM